MSTAANASHLLLELLQRGGFAASMVLWRDTESERDCRAKAKDQENDEDKDRARENKVLDGEERL